MNSVYNLFVWWAPIMSSDSGLSAALNEFKNAYITWLPYMSIISFCACSCILWIIWINILWHWVCDSVYLNPFILLKSSFDCWMILIYEFMFSLILFESFSMSTWMTLVPWTLRETVTIEELIMSTIIWISRLSDSSTIFWQR